MELVKSTYHSEDVEILLKDITGAVDPLPTAEREKLIQSGVHYCEMLPLEYSPTEAYMREYTSALDNFSQITADAVHIVSERIYQKKKRPVLVSLARAGISAGVLIKHYIEKKYSIVVPHYAISIIRGRGIDKNAMNYIINRHSREDIQFVDGWIGKGAIQNQLNEAMQDYPNVSPELAVIADPAGITGLCGSRDDFLIASSCLNSTVSGLISRTFHRADIIGNDDFHGAVYYGDLKKYDRTYEFIYSIEKYMDYSGELPDDFILKHFGIEDVRAIQKDYNISDVNLVKPGIGETTRVLLRRVPYKILVSPNCDSYYISHILRLAKEKGVPVEKYNLNCYRCCGIIKNMPSDA